MNDFTEKFTQITEHFAVERDYKRGYRLVHNLTGKGRSSWTTDTDWILARAATEEAAIAERAAKTTETTTPEPATKPADDAPTRSQLDYIARLLRQVDPQDFEGSFNIHPRTKADASWTINYLEGLR